MLIETQAGAFASPMEMRRRLIYQERHLSDKGRPMQKKQAATSKISARRQTARKLAAVDYSKRRATVLTAAAAVFKELGYGAATVDDVARRAAMDRASVYYYFHGKEDLFREMVGGATTENVEMAEHIAKSDRDTEDKLRVLIHGLFNSYERHFPYLYVYVQEDMSRLLQDKSAWSKKFARSITASTLRSWELFKRDLTAAVSSRRATPSCWPLAWSACATGATDGSSQTGNIARPRSPTLSPIW